MQSFPNLLETEDAFISTDILHIGEVSTELHFLAVESLDDWFDHAESGIIGIGLSPPLSRHRVAPPLLAMKFPSQVYALALDSDSGELQLGGVEARLLNNTSFIWAPVVPTVREPHAWSRIHAGQCECDTCFLCGLFALAVRVRSLTMGSATMPLQEQVAVIASAEPCLVWTMTQPHTGIHSRRCCPHG